MTRRERRQYTVAAGFTAVGISILLLVALLMPGGPSTKSQFFALVRDNSVSPAVTGESTELSSTRELLRAPSASLTPKTTGSDSLTVPSAADVADDVTAPTAESSPRQRPELPGPAASASDGAPDASYSTSPTARQLEARASSGFAPAPAAFPFGGGAGWAGVAAGGGDGAVDASSQTADVSGLRAGDDLNQAVDPSEGGASASPADGALADRPSSPFADRNASLAANVMKELTESSVLFDPVVVSGPDPLSQLVLPDPYLDGVDEPAALAALAAAAGVELTAPLGLPVAPPAAPLGATAPARPTVVNPEPATLLMLGTGLGLAAHYTRRRRPRTTRTGSV